MTRLRLDILDHVCESAGPHGDDLWGRSATAVWVLDGATGLSTERLIAAGASDAAWFAAAVDEELRRADWSKPARAVLRAAAAAVDARFRREAKKIPADESTWPAAAIAILRVAEGAIELSNLGDCKLLFRAASGLFATFGSSAVTALDRQLVALMVELQSQGVTDPADLWSRLVPVMQQGRRLRNTEGGYWVLDVAGHGVTQVEEAMLPAGAIRDFLLVTDGFYRLVDAYGVYSDEQLLDAALARGLGALCAELRAIEAADERCAVYPRVKARDDATAVLGRVLDG